GDVVLQVRRLAALGVDQRLDRRGPLPAGQEGAVAERDAAERDEVEPAPVEGPGFVRGGEGLFLHARHRWVSRRGQRCFSRSSARAAWSVSHDPGAPAARRASTARAWALPTRSSTCRARTYRSSPGDAGRFSQSSSSFCRRLRASAEVLGSAAALRRSGSTTGPSFLRSRSAASRTRYLSLSSFASRSFT